LFVTVGSHCIQILQREAMVDYCGAPETLFVIIKEWPKDSQ